jgi:DNA-binding CsgD family transcriptional regulator
LTQRAAMGRIRVAIELDDAALADRIASAMREVAAFDLVGAEDAADIRIVPGREAAETADSGRALTARELEVLALLAEGASNKLIARRLGISAHTAKYHVASLLEKLDAVSRTDAVAHAARLGVITL